MNRSEFKVKMGEIVDYINENLCSVKQACEYFDLPFKEARLRIRLKASNYVYNLSTKQWEGGDREADTDEIKTVSNRSEKRVNSLFTPGEIEVLKNIIKEYQNKEDKSDVLTEDDLLKRISSLGEKQAKRKTMVLSNEAAKQLDLFCDETRVNKGDIVSLAILDFIKSYEYKL